MSVLYTYKQTQYNTEHSRQQIDILEITPVSLSPSFRRIFRRAYRSNLTYYTSASLLLQPCHIIHRRASCSSPIILCQWFISELSLQLQAYVYPNLTASLLLTRAAILHMTSLCNCVQSVRLLRVDIVIQLIRLTQISIHFTNSLSVHHYYSYYQLLLLLITINDYYYFLSYFQIILPFDTSSSIFIVSSLITCIMRIMVTLTCYMI